MQDHQREVQVTTAFIIAGVEVLLLVAAVAVWIKAKGVERD